MAKSNTVRTSVLVTVAPPGDNLCNLKYHMLIVPPSTSTNINVNTHTPTYVCVYIYIYIHAHLFLDTLAWETSKFNFIDFGV